MAIQIPKDTQIAQFGGVIQEFPRPIQDSINHIPLSEVGQMLSPGRYEFVAVNTPESVPTRLGGLIILIHPITEANPSPYRHCEIARAAQIAYHNCFGGILDVDAEGQILLNPLPCQDPAIRIIPGGDDCFQSAFEKALRVSEVTGICLVNPAYLDMLNSEHGSALCPHVY